MMDIIADTISIAPILAPVEYIDLTEWLFTLTDEEYQACSPAHIGAGTSITVDGKRISVNVEAVGGNMLVQHYIADIADRLHCRVNSLSDSFSPAGRTRLGVTWELKVIKKTASISELHNRVQVFFTEDFRALLASNNITDLTGVKAGMHKNVEAHNKEETPFFAKDIEAKALSGRWI